jgi:RHS repeat-associated protein
MTRESSNRNLEYDYRQRTRLYFITNNTTLYEQYTYGADGNVVTRLNRSSGLIYSYVYIDGLFQYSDQIGHASNAQNHINILDQSGAIISQHRQGTFSGEVAYNNGELYMINNHVGSVIGTYDLNGTQQEGEDYYPFGDSSHHWNGNKQQRFAGKIRLSWTGYYDFGARQYIPWLAKFTSVDPLAAKSTDRNPYHYASNNPINHTDPTGMSDGKGDGKGGGDSAKAASSRSNTTTQKTPVHQVKKGETLSSIAKQHGTTVEKLREANNLDPRNDKKLQIGKELSLGFNSNDEIANPKGSSLKFSADPKKSQVEQDATFREKARSPINIIDSDNRKERFTFYRELEYGVHFPLGEAKREESYKIIPIEDPAKGTGGWSAVSNFFERVSNIVNAILRLEDIYGMSSSYKTNDPESSQLSSDIPDISGITLDTIKMQNVFSKSTTGIDSVGHPHTDSLMLIFKNGEHIKTKPRKSENYYDINR